MRLIDVITIAVTELTHSHILIVFIITGETHTVLLFILVMAFNLFTDALQDAFDPKKVN